MRVILAIACALVPITFGQFANTRIESNGDMTTIMYSGLDYMGPAVMGKPYSAEEVSERVETLANGTHIRNNPPARKIWRDFDGRTRTERTRNFGRPAEKAGFVIVEIQDPVAGFFYVLDQENKVAHRLAMPERPAASPPVLRTGVAVPAAPRKSSGESNYERLGPETIEGVTATGYRSTRTMPVGEIGNDAPLVSTSEYWRSTDLDVSVLSKYSDPRMGDQVTRLTNISRTAPEPSLFMPPPDYKVVEEKDSFSILYKTQR